MKELALMDDIATRVRRRPAKSSKNVRHAQQEPAEAYSAISCRYEARNHAQSDGPDECGKGEAGRCQN